LELGPCESARGSTSIPTDEELRALLYARQHISDIILEPTHAENCRTCVQLPESISEGTPGTGSLVRLVFSSCKVTEAEVETVRRLLTAVRVQARAAAACRTVVNAELDQTFAGSGDEARGNSVLFETRAA
jgi:hypothetical protein